MMLARRFNGEIIGADSRQIYRYMDIGTAKPTPEQQEQVPHHLIDVVDPDENLGLAQYQRLTMAAIHAVHERGRLPLLVLLDPTLHRAHEINHPFLHIECVFDKRAIRSDSKRD